MGLAAIVARDLRPSRPRCGQRTRGERVFAATQAGFGHVHRDGQRRPGLLGFGEKRDPHLRTGNAPDRAAGRGCLHGNRFFQRPVHPLSREQRHVRGLLHGPHQGPRKRLRGRHGAQRWRKREPDAVVQQPGRACDPGDDELVEQRPFEVARLRRGEGAGVESPAAQDAGAPPGGDDWQLPGHDRLDCGNHHHLGHGLYPRLVRRVPRSREGQQREAPAVPHRGEAVDVLGEQLRLGHGEFLGALVRLLHHLLGLPGGGLLGQEPVRGVYDLAHVRLVHDAGNVLP
mmetsp:Transcript_121620/g.349549  ORF Transcript_121620/g.349549 Transcript_121620/m.349549 type:complete len:286 (+) Transcript_121620:395-1252(+)